MTRAEAIKILKAAETDHFPYEPEKLVEAFELAIASLETDEAYQLEYEKIKQLQNRCHALTHGQICGFCPYECEHKTETEAEDDNT